MLGHLAPRRGVQDDAKMPHRHIRTVHAISGFIAAPGIA